MIDYKIINKCDFPILSVNNFISDDDLYIDIDSDFTGGENQISNDEYIIGNDNTPYNVDISTKPKDNMLIIMPSWVTHRVSPVFCKSKDKLKGRITINGHIGYIK